MAESTAIEWADHTFNPWIGCTSISPACDNCYAERFAKRLGVGWGPHAERRFAGETSWKNTETWNRRAAREGVRRRVFGPSLADPFDNAVPISWLLVYLDHIRRMDALDWLLLTKRPQNIMRRLREAREDATPKWGTVRWGTGPVAAWLDRWLAGEAPANVWLGTTVENQAEADRRVPHLLAVPARMRFLSCEPLLGPVDLTRICIIPRQSEFLRAGIHVDALRGSYVESGMPYIGEWDISEPYPEGAARRWVNWVIAGGESGPKARPSHPDWLRGLRDQCANAGVPFFFKQWGEWAPPGIMTIDDEPQMRLQQRMAAHPELVHIFEDRMNMGRIGKKATGRLLDGEEYSAVPGGRNE